MAYGKEQILDLYECDVSKFNREDLEQYCIELCALIDMERGPIEFWDYEGWPEEHEAAPIHLSGITAIQFISTSNITIHALDKVGEMMINVFSCKDFDVNKVRKFTAKRFRSAYLGEQIIVRGERSKCQNL